MRFTGWGDIHWEIAKEVAHKVPGVTYTEAFEAARVVVVLKVSVDAMHHLDVNAGQLADWVDQAIREVAA